MYVTSMRIDNMYKILIVMLLVGCGTDRASMVPTRVDQGLQKYVDKFFEIAENRGKSWGSQVLLRSVEYVDKLDEPTTIGLCETRNFGNRIYIVSGRSFYMTLSTLYHELGHCVYGLGHNNGTIMAAWEEHTENYYIQHWIEEEDRFWDLVPNQ
jgi:hypothetical protein